MEKIVNMHSEITGSLKEQCDERLTNLYNESYIWLLQVSFNICKSSVEAEELCSDLFVYLAKEQRPKLFWGNSYNLMYCMKFIKHRWINRVGKLKRYNYMESMQVLDKADDEYDYERDNDVMRAYSEVMDELKSLSATKNWAPARIFELYWGSDTTLNKLAQDIGISKSTTFLAIKKIRKHMATVIDTPFKKE
jgi:DNA-directed RNA polymerase specialized sigma24 family protein